MPEFNALLPVLTLLLGAAVGYFADERRDSRLAAREAAAASLQRERQEQADERPLRREEAADERTRQRERDGFQRQTLIALQDASARLVRASGAIHHQDVLRFRETGRWARDPTTEQWDETLTEAMADVQRYRARVDNDAIRAAVGELVGRLVEANMGAMRDEEDRVAYAVADQASKAGADAVPGPAAGHRRRAAGAGLALTFASQGGASTADDGRGYGCSARSTSGAAAHVSV